MSEFDLLPWLDKVYGSLEVTAILVGITLNSLTLRYFQKRSHQLSNLLFFFIALSDLLILTTCLPSAISILSERRPVLFAYRGMCILTGFLFNIASRMSVFLIALLALARAISLVFPLRRGRKKSSYLVPLVLYFVLNIVLASLPLIFSKDMYYYLSQGAQCSWGIQELSFVNSHTTFYGLTYTTIIVPWFIPGVIVLVSCVISLNTLIKSGKRRRIMTQSFNYTQISLNCSSSRKSREKSDQKPATRCTTYQATMTVVIATAVYIVFNVPCWLFNVIILLSLRNQDITKYFNGMTGIYLNYFMGVLSVVLNSASNPIVYFFRMDVLRQEIKASFEDLVSWAKERVHGCSASRGDLV